MWGDAAQQRAFAEIYPLWYGTIDERNKHGAVQRLLPMADQGYAPAMFAVGWAYFTAEGVRRDYVKSFRWCMGAAEQGYPSAEGMLGSFYVMARPAHRACELDPAEAARWYRLAAEHGNSGGGYNLASQYLRGYGVERSAAQAYVWASLAVHCSPIRSIPAEVLRDQAAAGLAPEEKVTAQELIQRLSRSLPHPWSEHMTYWRMLASSASIVRKGGSHESTA